MLNTFLPLSTNKLMRQIHDYPHGLRGKSQLVSGRAMIHLDLNCYALLFLNKSGNAYFHSLVAGSDLGVSRAQRKIPVGYLCADSSI